MGQKHVDLVGAELHIARSQVGTVDPNGVITAGVIGQFHWDTANNKLYIAEAADNVSWVHAGIENDTWTDLSDTPASISADGHVKGNSGGTALVQGQAVDTTDSPQFANLTVLTDGDLGFGTQFFTQDPVLGPILQLTDPNFTVVYNGLASLNQKGTSSTVGILSENQISGQDSVGNSRVYGALKTSIEDNTLGNYTGSIELAVSYQGVAILRSILGINVNQQKEVFIYDNIRFRNLSTGADPILTANATDQTLALTGNLDMGTSSIKFTDGSIISSGSDIFQLFSEDSHLFKTSKTTFFTVQLESARNTVGTFGHLDFVAKDAGGTFTIYASIDSVIVDPANGVETGAVRIGVTQDGIKDVSVIGFNESDRLETLIYHDLEIKNQGAGLDPVLSSNSSERLLGLVGSFSIASLSTTINALDVVASDLATGYVAQFSSDSPDASNRRILSVINDNPLAIGAVALYIRQDSTADIVNIFDGGTEVFTILDGGNVGIGTNNPDALLNIESATTELALHIEGLHVEGVSLSLDALGASGEEWKFLSTNSSNSIGPGHLRIINTDALVEVTIRNTGRVGIGVTAPATTLDVFGDITVGDGSGISKIDFRSGGTQHLISMSNSGISKPTSEVGWKVKIWDPGTLVNTYGMGIDTGTLWFQTGGTHIEFWESGVERMVIASGNVGINVVIPQARLQIAQTDGAAEPVLALDQEDLSEEMIQFDTVIGVGNPIEAVGVKTLTTTHFIKITIGGLVRYIPCGTIA